MSQIVYGYIRVSTDKQTTENQKYEIQIFAKEKGLVVQRWVEETVSGTKKVSKRKLGTLIRNLKAEDILITTEISRIGRRIFEVMNVFYTLIEKGVIMYSVKEHFQLEDTFIACLISFSYMMQAQIERELISSRTKNGLARRVSEGVKLGRKIGGENKYHKLSGKEDLIRTMVNYHYTKADICRKFKCNPVTLDNQLKRMGIEWEKKPKFHKKKGQ